MKTDSIFAYPDLAPEQKLQLERTILQTPCDLGLAELAHLLTTPFPFENRTRSWLERYIQLRVIYQQLGPLAELDRTMSGWAKKQRTRRNQGRLPLERERALNRIGFVWNVNGAMWQKQYARFLVYQNDPQATASNSLHAWMSSMRKKWNRLTPLQRRLLQEAGLVRV